MNQKACDCAEDYCHKAYGIDGIALGWAQYCKKGYGTPAQPKLIWQTETLNGCCKVRIELWPEGLVVWVGGEIKWKSWEQNSIFDWARDHKVGDTLKIRLPKDYKVLDDVKDKQMTRNEAIEKAKKAVGIIEVLEALGLLKFEEEKEKTVNEILNECTGPSGAKWIKDKLEKHGYLIVKKDKFAQIWINDADFTQGVLKDVKQ